MTSTTPITGFISAPDTSGGAVDQTGFDLYRLLNTSTAPFSAGLNITAESFDVTAFASSLVAVDKIQGLKGFTASFSGRYPRCTPKAGHEGLVTYSNGYTVGCRSWSITVNAGTEDDTALSSTPPEWMDSIPNLISASGTFEAVIDDTTAISLPNTGAATFRLNTESGDDNTVAGNIGITGVSSTIALGNGRNLVTYTFDFDGNLTFAGDNSLFAAGALTKPDLTEIVIKADNSRTYTGTTHWTSITMGAAIGSPIEVSGSLQGSGALVVA